ncbi:glycosyltransferase family 2 protein [Gorillibacterium massiliense]|uniref:glycosyltransferase family 2 protein n=1 Tax=Gorillibacterium massiliense TaxID=1280390 RepID=UPI0004BACFE9|nr:glycosyltransferase family 2 protein [Gorillibacterium massiliense]
MNVSVCICTRNRPEDLANALKSVRKSRFPIHQIIVSDDGTDNRTKELVLADFPEVTYLEGPRKGLCPNRNNALRHVTGTHVLFMDDDVLLDQEFFNEMDLRLAEYGTYDNVIVTGLEKRNGFLVHPHDQSFLGFQRKAYSNRDELKTVVINSTLFPAEMFKTIRFDEQLVYGYDEVDITTRAFHSQYRIILCETAVNQHFPSPVNRDLYQPYTEASRIYVTFKRYYHSENKPWKGIAFLSGALAHAMAYGLKNSGVKGLSKAAFTCKTSLTYIRNLRKQAA